MPGRGVRHRRVLHAAVGHRPEGGRRQPYQGVRSVACPAPSVIARSEAAQVSATAEGVARYGIASLRAPARPAAQSDPSAHPRDTLEGRVAAGCRGRTMRGGNPTPQRPVSCSQSSIPAAAARPPAKAPWSR